MKLKKGDTVVIIAGKEKGKTGAIVRVLPSRDMLVLDKLNLVKRHRRPTSAGRKGQIVEISAPIHASNVQLLDPKDGKPTRIKITRSSEGVRSRVAVKSGETLK